MQISHRHLVMVCFIMALVAFEMFNFDTTRYALSDFLGNKRFMGLTWAGILALAFCAIDFAGLLRIFTPEQKEAQQTGVWYLMGAWLLGATMNALMTWWAVSLTLLDHDLGNEVLTREQLLQIVPFFVATMVWLTRILFIGSVSVASDYLFGQEAKRPQPRVRPRQTQPLTPPQKPPMRAPRPRPQAPSTPIPMTQPTMRPPIQAKPDSN